MNGRAMHDWTKTMRGSGLRDRRKFLAGGAACGLMACAGFPFMSAAETGRLLTIAIGWVPNAEYADIFVGMEKQHFASAGLTIKYIDGGPNAPVSLVALAAGQADIAGTSWLQLLDAVAHAEAGRYLGAENVLETEVRLGAEDFGYYTRQIPGCFYRLGVMNTEKGITSGVHTPTFNIDESAIEIGVGMMAWLGSHVEFNGA